MPDRIECRVSNGRSVPILIRVEPMGREYRLHPGSTLWVAAWDGEWPCEPVPQFLVGEEDAATVVWIDWRGAIWAAEIQGDA